MQEVYCVFGGPDVDIYVNGEVAVNGGVPQTNVRTLETWGYLYLAPNTYSVAVVPTGMDLDQVLMGPVDVTVEAGHRYTVVVLGQVDEAEHQPLVIDETVTFQKIGASPTDIAHITINNVRGVSGIDTSLDRVVLEKNAPFGGFKAGTWPAGSLSGQTVTITGAPDQVLVTKGEFFALGDFIDCFGGTYPGTLGLDFDTKGSPFTSALNTINYLQLQSDVAAQENGHTLAFSSFLSAIKTAGVTDLLTTESPYLLFAPTDEAFAALPEDQLDALMADPKALADMPRNHIVAGFYPRGSLGTGGFDGTVTNLMGAPLVLFGFGRLAINGVTMGGDDSVMVANGSRVYFVTKLLLPPDN